MIVSSEDGEEGGESVIIEPLTPDPYYVIESIRHMGYSLPEALCDVIDNSVDAGATEIYVSLDWNASLPLIAIADNGKGMDEAALLLALSPGVIDSRGARESGALGRFGLGLKSASLSQANSLTVFSKTATSFCYLRWVVSGADEGLNEPARLERSFTRSAENRAQASLGHVESGTVVVWERLALTSSSRSSERAFIALYPRIELFLALTYHRFLSDPAKSLQIWFNGNRIAPCDPAYVDASARQLEPIRLATLGNQQTVSVQGVVVCMDQNGAERSKLVSVLKPGLYIYRNGRLVVRGGWAGLSGVRMIRARDSVRLLVDLESHHDDSWGINIAKSSVSLPSWASASLVAYVERLAAEAKRSARLLRGPQPRVNRSSVRGQSDGVALYSGYNVGDGRRLEFENQHPLMKVFRGLLAEESWGDFVKVLEIFTTLVEIQSSTNGDVVQGMDTALALKMSIEDMVDCGAVSKGLEPELIDVVLKALVARE